jgi:hypothetical protein
VVVELVADLVLEFSAQLGPEPVEMVVELVPYLVPEAVEMVVELVADLVLELSSQARNLSPDILKVRLQDWPGCSAQACFPGVHSV